MTVEEVTQAVQKFGYQLTVHHEDVNAYLFYKDPSQPPIALRFNHNQGLVGKTIHIEEEFNKDIEIDDILERHKESYLALTAIDFDEAVYIPKELDNFHREIFFYKEDYSGVIQFYISNGKVWAFYDLMKI